MVYSVFMLEYYVDVVVFWLVVAIRRCCDTVAKNVCDLVLETV